MMLSALLPLSVNSRNRFGAAGKSADAALSQHQDQEPRAHAIHSDVTIGNQRHLAAFAAAGLDAQLASFFIVT
jgi:hypothetical protein